MRKALRPLAHFWTVTRHRWLVRRYCFRLGLYWQGLTHDLSKYSPAEFWRGAKYYRGNVSPNYPERLEHGYSAAWLHHKGRNRHHCDYWLDFIPQPDGSFVFGPCPMPMKYLGEMFCDRLAANRIYHGMQCSNALPYEFFEKTRSQLPMHPDSMAEMEKMLLTLRDEGEAAAFRYVRRRLQEERSARTR